MRLIRSHAPARSRLILAMFCAFGLAGRIAAPMLPMPAMAAAMLLESGICHVDPDGDSNDRPHPAQDCQSCPACHAVAHAGLLPMPAPALAIPTAWFAAATFARPAATGPPGRAVTPFQSRAPPIFSV